MAEKRQQEGDQANLVKLLYFAQMLRRVAGTRGEDATKGMVIKGVSGIGKTIAVVTYVPHDKQ